MEAKRALEIIVFVLGTMALGIGMASAETDTATPQPTPAPDDGVVLASVSNYVSNDAGCTAYYLTPAPITYCVERTGRGFSCGTSAEQSYSLSGFEALINNMNPTCLSKSFAQSIVSAYNSRCAPSTCNSGYTYSNLAPLIASQRTGTAYAVGTRACYYYSQASGCGGGGGGSIACSSSSQCGANGYLNTPYCSSGSVYDTYRTYTCNSPGTTSSYCTSSNAAQQKQACTNGCTSGACNSGGGIACTTNSQCGINAYTGSPYCSGNSVYQSYRSYSCNNPGTTASYCASSDSTQLKQTCSAGQTCSTGACQNTQTCTDNDGDGYKTQGGTCGQVDCNDNDKTISPSLAESCNNRGIDDNCNGVQDEGCPALQNWVPRKWSNLKEYKRTQDYVGYTQSFSWDAPSLENLRNLDARTLYNCRMV